MILTTETSGREGVISNSFYHPVTTKRDRVTLLVLATLASLASFLYFFQRQEILLYGDAVAHINIARRVFDSRSPGPLQLGTVWLPLPHLLTLPFIINDWAWRSGVGGSVVSMAAYVWGTLGIFRLARSRSQSRGTAWLAAFIYAVNPNLLYLQATAMTESLALACMVWAVVYASELDLALHTLRGGREAVQFAVRRNLERCGLALLAGMLTRYDSWFLAIFVSFYVYLTLFRARDALFGSLPQAADKSWKRGVINYVLLTALAPVLWFAYNHGIYQNALEFANGPYSARAIAEKTSQVGQPMYPGYHNVKTATLYFNMATKLSFGPKLWQHGTLMLAWGGFIFALAFWRRYAVLLLLWVPMVFYPLAMAYGGVPIFLPVWWPHSYYNVRYGLQMLPAIAVLSGLCLELVSLKIPPRWAARALAAGLAYCAAVYMTAAWQVPLCLREAQVNAVTRMAFEHQLAAELRKLPSQASLLMFTGNHVGALQETGIHLRRTVNEGNFEIWQSALARPAEAADYVVAMRGDAVWDAVQRHPGHLQAIAWISTEGQPEAVIYRAPQASTQ